ncbi:MAG TPA: Rieske (2Fe-2S) protein [Acidimicrobiales bacterium]|nr:Rieske (2Fe-2S) protein [Acidimicrobiales bacterium]
MEPVRVTVGALEELQSAGFLTGKAGSQPVCVFWHEGAAYALDDRCPHMGFPLHRGTVESGLVTCHWHNARFDLCSGGTLDPFADDVRAYPVEIVDGDVVVVVGGDGFGAEHHRRRLEDGLEQGLTLVMAKAVLGLLEGSGPSGGPEDVVRVGLDFGTTYRADGWGAGLTVLVAMANVLPELDEADRPLALVHALAFVSRDTRGRPPRFPLAPLGTSVPAERLAGWYRRFIETRSSDAGERTLVSALRSSESLSGIEAMMTAAATDHVFLDGGHTLDFTNKAFEAVGLLGVDVAPQVLPTLVRGTARASRAEEGGSWRHPVDLVALMDSAFGRLPELLAVVDPLAAGSWDNVAGLAWTMLGEDPAVIVGAICAAIAAGATPEQLGRSVAYAGALRITRFHTQNDHGDWDVVHHGFTAANAVHQMLVRSPSPELLRAVFHGAMRVYQDRFLNVPAARPPQVREGVHLEELSSCWDEQGRVDDAGALAYSWLFAGGDARSLVAALGGALLAEDAGFHWYQTYEAAVRQFHAWPVGSEEGRLILVGCARFLAAHTPTRRELAQVVRTATRLRRGEALFEEA